jgi:hypothetical protein
MALTPLSAATDRRLSAARRAVAWTLTAGIAVVVLVTTSVILLAVFQRVSAIADALSS